VNSVHGSDIFLVGKPKVKYSRALRFLLGAADLVVTPSRQYKKVLLDLFPSLKDKTTFIHNGVNLAELQSCSRETAKRNQDRYILCIAGHNENKGLDVLLHAFKELQELAPSLQLILAGDGPLRGQLEALATSLGIAERTKFVGFQDRTQVAKLLQNCEIFVLPSRAESFGIAVAEALACKKPVVATAVGGIPEIIEDGKTGILVEPDNPGRLAEGLAAVLTDTVLRETIAANGYRTVVQRFCHDHTGAAYEAAFAELLESSPAGVYTHSE
jgi:glycosyltransferase involved in cell wall biosynthesis